LTLSRISTNDGRGADGTAGDGLSVTIDGALVGITGHGFWSDDGVDNHFIALRRIVAVARTRHPRFRVLVDLRTSAVQTRAIGERIERETRSIWTPADRIAMVLRPGLAKLQMNRIVDGQNHQIFDRIDLARQWLDREQD
jgi:hypothetical protein